MADPDGPRFLTGTPLPPAPVPVPVPVPAPKRAKPAAPPPVPTPAPQKDAPPPDWLAEMLGPGKMPRVMMRYPRICGLALLALGIWFAYDIFDVVENGGRIGRITVFAMPILVLLGGWFVATGRPADSEGYSPPWWNMGYVAMILIGAVTGVLVRILYFR